MDGGFVVLSDSSKKKHFSMGNYIVTAEARPRYKRYSRGSTGGTRSSEQPSSKTGRYLHYILQTKDVCLCVCVPHRRCMPMFDIKALAEERITSAAW